MIAMYVRISDSIFWKCEGEKRSVVEHTVCLIRTVLKHMKIVFSEFM